MHEIDFAKGHGTRNDFVLFTDADGTIRLTAEQVRALCDRRAGIGADGVLRAVRGRHVPQWDGNPEVWFMDYRNADGSIAEMCGNGLRVFARYLVEQGLADGPAFDVGTRAGLRRVTIGEDGMAAADMGEVRVGGVVTVFHSGARYLARAVDVGNPHAVVVLQPGQSVDAINLTCGPSWEPESAFPDGVNVEFLEAGGSGLRMRVHERGVGETFSCGTGVVAAAAAFCAAGGTPPEVVVNVLGGTLRVRFDHPVWLNEGIAAPAEPPMRHPRAVLIGPAVIVAHGSVDLDALSAPAQRHAAPLSPSEAR